MRFDKTDSPEAMAEEARLARLAMFANVLATKRSDAIEARASSGIEKTWREDDEFYDAIDDANRDEVEKSKTLNGSPTINPESNAAPKTTTVFVNITQPYVDMASARVADMLLPTDDMPFGLEATPMPDIAAAKNDKTIFTRPDGAKAEAGAIALEMLDAAKKSADKAQERVWDWLVESKWHGEVRKVIEDSARRGTGILKGPFAASVKSKKMNRLPTGHYEVQIQHKVVPAVKRINVWDFFPDGACGESIHNGSYTWERDRITARSLRDLKKELDVDDAPAYIASQIDAVLEEGPSKKQGGGKIIDETKSDKEQFEIWYYHGFANAEDLRAAGCECDDDKDFPVMVVMVNDRIIKATIAPLDSGDFPYDVMVWQRQSGTWTGIGVARQIRNPQRIVNAATRSMLTNAGLAAGPQIGVRRGDMAPANGRWELTPNKLWLLDKDSDVKSISDAISVMLIPSVQGELMNIVKYGMELAEKVTSMPLMLQGEQGAATQTVGGMTILQNNASTVLRRIAKIFDDNITTPKLTKFYEWLMLYGPEEDEKGDFQIVAHGSTALFERDAQNQAILQMGALVKDPAFRINPAKWIVEAFKAQKLDPARFQYTDEEWAEVQKQMQEQGQPKAPAVEAAEIRAEVDKYKTDKMAEVTVQKSKIDTDRDTVYVQAQQARDHENHLATMRELEIKERLAMLDYANKRNISLDNVKKELAKTAMTLRAQKEMSNTNGKGPQVAKPIVEPAGRAPEGQAFQK
jgi:hypothetical protein